jgi:hypothetical protein
MLADLLGQLWPHSLLEKPFFIVNDFALLAEYNLLFYTINGSSVIYARDILTNTLLAKLAGHSSTPVFQLIDSALMLVSADAAKIRGESTDIRIWRLE